MDEFSKNLNSIHLKKEELWLLEEKYKGVKTDAFLSDIARFKKGEPIDYIIGFTSFLGCHIDLSNSPLIPRTETEFWVERIIKKIQENKQSNLQCLDIFSGSGCIGIAIASHIKSATIDFGDNNENCLKQIQKNISNNKIKDSRINIYKSDCFESIPKKKYDYIFANPPYIARERENNIQKTVVDWEPINALFAEDNGLYYIKKIIKQSTSFLAKNGTLIIEFDSCQKEIIEEKIISKDIYKSTFEKDQFGKWRTVVLQNLPAGRQ